MADVDYLEELRKELEQKYKELDEYLETHKDYLSNEAEAMRREIYRLEDNVKLFEKAKKELNNTKI